MFNISAYEEDVLRELSNIGSGNAATSLSIMLNKRVDINIPVVKFTNFKDVPDLLENKTQERVIFTFKLTEAIKGCIGFIVTNDELERIGKTASQGYEIDSKTVVSEISNIISGAYIGAIANMMNTTINISPPEITQDKLDDLFNSTKLYIKNLSDKILFISTRLIIEDEKFSGFYIFFLESNSLRKILDYFKAY
ncbi:MAG: hypothetical protein A2255_00590 [Candidatus Melainabacteria bacterium RIFOXYA2_FULL_32_9]|nr:MAG: hypothetical protein A2255_00590 [Candidatus Melainabacteria bacterium RIFOXYA2_FULL_32_9]